MIQPVVEVSGFGEVEGQKVELYTITFPGKLEAGITNYGGILTSLKVPDKTGKLDDIVLGYDHLEEYLKETPYFGAIVGRFANRIANGKFKLGGEKYKLALNSGLNHIHGGIVGFDKVVWEAEPKVENEKVHIILTYTSPDGEEGYPGTLKTKVTYTFTQNGLTIGYKATTNKPTILNLTQHSYFNLSGSFSHAILDHELLLNANQFLPINKHQIPTGKLESVTLTPFDFTSFKTIGKEIGLDDKQLKNGSGYDHCWVFDEERNVEEVVAALHHPQSGRIMEVITTEPGIQFYTSNFLDNSIPGKKGVFYKKHSALCLETQHFPDSPNHTNFPSVVLMPGNTFMSSTTYRFSVK